MSRRSYTVDWSDQAFPQVVVYDPEARIGIPQTLAEAKAEIIESFAHQISHARMIMKQIRAVRAADFDSNPAADENAGGK